MALNFNNCGTGGGGETYAAGPGVKISPQNEISADVRESEIAMVEQSTATEPHEVGEYIIVNNVLYKVTAAIAVDDAIVDGTNVEETNVGNEQAAINTKLTVSEYNTGIGNYTVRKVGGMVTLSIAQVQVNLDTALVPVGYRPISSVCGVCYYSESTVWKLAWFAVRATGEIGITTTENVRITGVRNVMLNATYPAQE